jgi:broad specificity phosphatase PhoE
MGKIILARHGESVKNRQKRISGTINTPLTAQGKKQAEELADKCLLLPITCIYSSNLVRAKRTARICGSILSRPVIIVPQLAERGYGSLENCPYSEIKNRATQWCEYNGKIFVVNAHGVETLSALYKRAQRALLIIRGDMAKRDGDALVISHGGMIRMMRLIHLKLSLGQYFAMGFVDNSDVVIID